MQRRYFLFILLSFIAHHFSLSQDAGGEATLKAAFIYNFTKYIEWDEPDKAADFIIGIVGSSSISTPLERIAQTNNVKGRRILIRHYISPEAIGFCHILFIAGNQSVSLPSILEKAGKGTLTVSEEPGYAKMGSAFNFILKNDKLKFEANLNAIYAANIKVSSQLLKLAILID
jgi:YfiR/HmsC-like